MPDGRLKWKFRIYNGSQKIPNRLAIGGIAECGVEGGCVVIRDGRRGGIGQRGGRVGQVRPAGG